MKRCFAVLLSMLLLLGSVPMVAADNIYNDDELNWGELTCSHENAIVKPAVPSTCITAGTAAYTFCEGCHLVIGIKETLPLADHTYDNACDTICNVEGCGNIREVGQHIYDHVCDADCNECGAIRTVDPHAYEVEVVEPTCTKNGKKVFTCAICGDSYEEAIPALGHDYMIDVTAPTCTESGYTTHTCSTCGDSYVADEIAALGHAYDNACDSDCNACGLVREVEPHKYNSEIILNATCTADGKMLYVCTICISMYTETIPASGHTSVVVNGYAPTCAEDGLTDGEECSVCHEILVAQESISATGHDYQAVVTAPTCVNDGYTTYTCSVCGDSYHEIIPALGHTVQVIMGYAATCQADGLTDGEQCAVCGEILVAQQVIPSVDHDYKAVVTAPTCENGGYTIYTCPMCEDSYVVDETAALGHHYEGEIWLRETCGYDGEKKYTCTNCGDTYYVTIPATGDHEFISDGSVEPTCEEDGADYFHCWECGNSQIVIIPATGHNYKAVVTAPTCVNGGYTTHTCSACRDSYVDGQIPALGHAYDDEYDAECNNCGYIREVSVLAGDVNRDGKVNNRDLGLLQRYLNAFEIKIDGVSADLDGNGKINNRDLGLLQRALNQ